MSKGSKFIFPEDFGFKPDSYLQSLWERSLDPNTGKIGLL